MHADCTAGETPAHLVLGADGGRGVTTLIAAQDISYDLQIYIDYISNFS